MKMEGRYHMNLDLKQPSYARWNQQTNTVSAVPPILSGQVWTGLSEPQQQMVAATVVKICQALAHHPGKPTESEIATDEHMR
jgi:hypothetical protein